MEQKNLQMVIHIWDNIVKVNQMDKVNIIG